LSRTVRIDLAYDGTDFHGWQMQSSLRSVQGDLEKMATRLLDRPVMPIGAGRTDAGVHALKQTAHITGLSEKEVERLERALFRLVPDDITILNVREVSNDFSARFSAVWRRYRYNMAWGRNIFQRRGEWQLNCDLDRAAMDRGAESLLGCHDYRSFCKMSSWKEDNHCDVTEARFEWWDDGAVFHVQANRFLHHMVRNMVGALVEVGKGEITVDDMIATLAACNREDTGTMAPARGLYLADVGYPDELMNPDFRSDQPWDAKSVQPEETP